MSYSDTPASDIRKWLWSELQSNSILSASSYNIPGMGSVVPIVPLRQEIELVDKLAGKPFITYDFVTEYVEPGIWYINCEQILYTVYCEDFATSTKIKNLMIDLFRRQDDSARDLNNASTSNLAYLNISIVENRWTSPERGDTGRNRFDMIIEVKYVRQLNSAGRYS
jgi:hypothetical protein